MNKKLVLFLAVVAASPPVLAEGILSRFGAEDGIITRYDREQQPRQIIIMPKQNQGAVNGRTGEYYAPAAQGYVNTSDGRYYAPIGPNAVVDTRTGQVIIVQ